MKGTLIFKEAFSRPESGFLDFTENTIPLLEFGGWALQWGPGHLGEAQVPAIAPPFPVNQ